MLVQMPPAKLGSVTGQHLAELCRERLPRPAAIGMWLQAEGVAVRYERSGVLIATAIVARHRGGDRHARRARIPTRPDHLRPSRSSGRSGSRSAAPR
jgi:hypothetical protein